MRALPTALLFLSGCSIEQGFAAKHWIDAFTQVPNNVVDILFVVDDSNSMAEEQEALAQGFQSFITQLEDAHADFHIGVITTSQDPDDPERGKLVGDPLFLTPQDDYVRLFQERVRVGISGADKERGLEAAAWAVSPESLLLHNITFLRPSGNLLVVFVSDEDDCSDDFRLEGQDADACYAQRDQLAPVHQLVNRIHDAKNDGELVQIGAIVGPYSDECGPNSAVGYRYVEAVQYTGGVLGSVCDGNWGKVLEELGLASLGIRRVFRLSYGADVATMEVTVDGERIEGDDVDGWTYDWQHWNLTFHGKSVPARGAEIVVEYDIAPYATPPLE